jgi:hypothetical protein
LPTKGAVLAIGNFLQIDCGCGGRHFRARPATKAAPRRTLTWSSPNSSTMMPLAWTMLSRIFT